MDLTYPVTELGNDPSVLKQIAAGVNDAFKALKAAKRPMLIVGQGALARADGAAILAACAKIAGETGMIGPGGENGWNGFNVLHTAAARMGALDIGFVPQRAGAMSRAFLRAPRRARSTSSISSAPTKSK